MEYLAAAAPNILSGTALLFIGWLVGKFGKAIVAVVRKGQNVAHEHTNLVDHLAESEELKAEIQAIREMQGPQNAALRELMGCKLDEEHARLVEQGYASPSEKMAFERKYKTYHGIGGNGTRTAHYEDVLKMNSYPTK